MQLSALSLAITRLGRVPAYSPLALFTGSTTGAWYDPSDITTLYRDAAGTQPVTAVEQPVGLMLDKSKGLVLGPELVTNGTQWTAVAPTASLWTPSTSTLRVTGGISGGTYYNYLATAGTIYKATFSVSVVSAGTWYVIAKAAANAGSSNLYVASGTTSTTVTFYFTNITATPSIYIQITNGGVIDVTNISVRELPGNHAFNSSGNSANFPVLSARYNLLTKSEDISAADWTKGGATAASTSSLLETATTGAHSCTLSPTTVAATYIYSVKLKANGRTRFAIAGTASLGGNLGNGIFFDLSTGSYVSGATGTPSITALSDGWYQVTYMWTALAGSGPLGVYLADSGTNTSYTGDVTKGMFIKEADLRVANDALNQPAYQRVNTSSDYDTVGFKPYLRFNGTNQWLQTNSIDFTYGDKMFVSAGVRKLSDAAQAIVVETSTSNGTFTVAAPRNAVPNYAWTSRGTLNVEATAPSSYSAPITNVVSGIGDISGSQSVIRVNSSQVANNSASQGTGNYSNLPLYLGARAGSSLWFNGRLYGMVVAGKQASDSEISQTEAFVNQKTGAY